MYNEFLFGMTPDVYTREIILLRKFPEWFCSDNRIGESTNIIAYKFIVNEIWNPSCKQYDLFYDWLEYLERNASAKKLTYHTYGGIRIGRDYDDIEEFGDPGEYEIYVRNELYVGSA